MGIQGNWAEDDMFPEVTKKILKEKERQEKRMRGEKKQRMQVAKIEKRLNKPLFKKGRTTKSKGKGLRVNIQKGTRGLFKLI